MSEKKRKTTSKDHDRPNKKQQTTDSVRVKHIRGSDVVKPVIATTPGISLPDVKFRSFGKPSNGKTNLLLHSSEHHTLNYTAREDDNSIEDQLKHYVGVFDPESKRLRVTEAKHLTVRSALRLGVTAREEQDEEEIAPVTNYTSRAALTAAFGTKKSKKAVQSMAENRLLAQGNGSADNPIAAAMLSNMTDEDIVNEIPIANALSNKPLPPPNLGTNEIDQVYSLNTLVQPSPADTTLAAMPINAWMARISAKKEVQARSRYVAFRVGEVGRHLAGTPNEVDPKATQALQVLRYIQLLLDLHRFVVRQGRKPIPPTDTWPEATLSESTPMALVRPIIKHFFPDYRPSNHSITLLRTTILALTLRIPPPSLNPGAGQLITEPTDISLDMAIEATEIRKLYRELGCKAASASEAELTKWGLEKLAKKRKDEAGHTIPKPIFMRLKFPLEFPKLSKGRQNAKR